MRLPVTFGLKIQKCNGLHWVSEAASLRILRKVFFSVVNKVKRFIQINHGHSSVISESFQGHFVVQELLLIPCECLF